MTDTNYLKDLRTLSDIKVKILEVKENAYYSGANVALLEELDGIIIAINKALWRIDND